MNRDLLFHKLAAKWDDSQHCEPEIGTLIRKVPSKRDYVSNFRPISLLNVKLKILTKVLEKMLMHVVEETCRENGGTCRSR